MEQATAQVSGEAPPKLLKNQDFVKVWSAQSVSVFGSTVSREALPLLAITVLGASAAQMGWLAAALSLPAFVLGLPAGAWADRLRRRPILITADIGRAVLLATIPLAALFGVLSLAQLFVVGVLVGCLTVFFDVADQSFLPTVVRDDQLIEANSKLGTSAAVAEVGGPALAGLLVQFVGATFAIALDALSFLWSAAFLGSVRKVEAPPVRPEQPTSIWQEIGEGLRYIRQNRVLFTLITASAVRTFFGGFFSALYGLFVLREAGLSPALLGLLVGAGGIGSLLGALLVGRFERKLGLRAALLYSFGISALLNLTIPAAGLVGNPGVAFGLLVAAQILGDTFLTVYFILEVSYRQSVTPERLQGRVNASTGFALGGALPLGAVLSGFAAELLGLSWALSIGVIGMIAATLILLRLFAPDA
jgi:MFS family permease